MSGLASGEAAAERYRQVCATCGSENVLADAYAEWDIENQCWSVQNVMDKGHYCNACDGECRIEARLEHGPAEEVHHA
jgi:hypothetical protein